MVLVISRRKHAEHNGLYDIHHLYSISRTKDALTYYLKSRDSRKKHVLKLPDFARGDFEPRNEDGRVVGFHAPHRFGTPL
ncbi:hypothetical protein RHSIM_Rhsim06G0114800 [Rhododendron simsii]|uniref:Uncharacterized protein n=1 Tax=Rhododendron simsii TaxID=118357 RepID=A0A834GT95_RHOSS|nr:hypothetical protein RHSIM_Rhsim06G0114800 [Rhododendron simsii]